MQVLVVYETGHWRGSHSEIQRTLVPLSQTLSVKPAACCPCVACLWLCVPVLMYVYVFQSGGGLTPGLNLSGTEGTEAGRPNH